MGSVWVQLSSGQAWPHTQPGAQCSELERDRCYSSSHRSEPMLGLPGWCCPLFSALFFPFWSAFHYPLLALLETPSTALWVLSLVGVPTLGILNLPAACGGLSIIWPASECHHFCCGLGRAEPLAWLTPRTVAESEWLMLENWPYSPPLFLDISTPPHLWLLWTLCHVEMGVFLFAVCAPSTAIVFWVVKPRTSGRRPPLNFGSRKSWLLHLFQCQHADPCRPLL